LYLSPEMSGALQSVIPASLTGGLDELWATDRNSPLLLPATAVSERRFRTEWRMATFASPSSVQLGVSGPDLADVAWSVLCRIPREDAVRLLADLSVVTDERWSDDDFLTSLVPHLVIPTRVKGPLIAEIRSGSPLYHPGCVRWILREVLACSEDERASRAGWYPGHSTGAELAAQAWLPCISRGTAPTTEELYTAVWMLHDDFHGSNRPLGDEEDVLSLVTTLGFRILGVGGWLAHLERWSLIWRTPDTHPCVRDSMAPSELRTAYSTELGLPVGGWLANVATYCLAWFAACQGQLDMSFMRKSSFDLTYLDRRVSLRFERAFRSNCVASVDELRRAELETAVPYRGLGSLDQGDALSLRNRPVVDFSNGDLIPVSLSLVAQRAVDLQRFMLPRALARGVRHALSQVGHLFEAYVCDLLDPPPRDHRVVAEQELSAALKGHSRCDLLIAYGQHVLAVEASTQSLGRGVARGDPEAIARMSRRYQVECNQAHATIDRLPEIADSLGIAPPRSGVALVVTADPFPISPLFVDALARSNTSRHPHFVCGINEFEQLVGLGRAGWSIPEAIGSWQQRGDRAPLDVHVSELGRTLAARLHHRDAESWIEDMDLE
jgi:hypothetical protein